MISTYLLYRSEDNWWAEVFADDYRGIQSSEAE